MKQYGEGAARQCIGKSGGKMAMEMTRSSLIVFCLTIVLFAWSKCRRVVVATETAEAIFKVRTHWRQSRMQQIVEFNFVAPACSGRIQIGTLVNIFKC